MIAKIIRKLKKYYSKFLTSISSYKLQKQKNIQPEAFVSGHYYSVIPSLEDVNNRSEMIYKTDKLGGININMDEQRKNLKELQLLHDQAPFHSSRLKRFQIENGSFSYDDAPVLHYMLRKIKPRQIIEIGSGNSSALMLDTNEYYMNNSIKEFTFIDIDLTLFKSNLIENDEMKINMLEMPIQDVDLTIFEKLEANDLLFIDSSHVSKIGSDLHTIMFEILPILKNGVYIHFHDIRFPFEYSRELINSKVFWNEAYLLRSFLMFNNSFQIEFWLNCLLNFENNTNQSKFDFLPLNEWDRLFNNSKGDIKGAGGSIYLKKVN